jgi:hypothetical protein
MARVRVERTRSRTGSIATGPAGRNRCQAVVLALPPGSSCNVATTFQHKRRASTLANDVPPDWL